MNGRPAALNISFNSSAVSNAKLRLSIAQGPEIKKNFRKVIELFNIISNLRIYFMRENSGSAISYCEEISNTDQHITGKSRMTQKTESTIQYVF